MRSDECGLFISPYLHHPVIECEHSRHQNGLQRSRSNCITHRQQPSVTQPHWRIVVPRQATEHHRTAAAAAAAASTLPRRHGAPSSHARAHTSCRSGNTQTASGRLDVHHVVREVTGAIMTFGRRCRFAAEHHNSSSVRFRQPAAANDRARLEQRVALWQHDAPRFGSEIEGVYLLSHISKQC
jgi:hypothetical protein